jgi:hypothetical protein
MRRTWRLWARIALCAATATVPVLTAGAAPPPPSTAQILRSLAPAVDPVIADLVEPGPDASPIALPADPAAALAGEVTRLGARLGVPFDPRPALARAHLHPALAGRLALLLVTLGACMDASDRLVAHLPVAPGALFDDRVAAGITLPAADVAAIRGCALRLERGGLELKRFLAGAPRDLGGSLALWPVLRLDNAGTDDVVLNDYVLSVDRGGDDHYYNNAGGNLIDVRRGPPGSQAPSIAPARGCVNPVYDLHEGQCVIAAALLLDMAGNDTYGRLEPADPKADGYCTDDPLVQRIMTEGAGFAGVGVLIDAAGDDTYVGKTMTQGAGHAGGVGILRDEQGNDVYTAIRMSKGIGVLQGTGILHDLAGNDLYTFRLPRPKVPGTPDGRPGAGGALSTTGLCDSLARWDEGTGFFNGVGVLVDDSGDDVYQAAVPVEHLSLNNPPLRHTGSLGYGDQAGFGVFIDRAGHDTYSGMPGRDNGVVTPPSAGSTGVFMDLQ